MDHFLIDPPQPENSVAMTRGVGMDTGTPDPTAMPVQSWTRYFYIGWPDRYRPGIGAEREIVVNQHWTMDTRTVLLNV